MSVGLSSPLVGEDPPTPPATPLGREQFDPEHPEFGALRPLLPSSDPNLRFDVRLQIGKTDQTVVFLGGTATLNRDRHGYVEASLTVAFPDRRPRFRNLAWQGDTVFYQQRPRFFYTSSQFEKGVADGRRKVPADIVFVEFGKMESLAGADALQPFTVAYERLLDQLQELTGGS